jgi:uncharacterized protein (TIGR02996 family)
MAKKKPPTAAEAFLQAICAEPDEDAHRLVYADWLDDHGDPDRAEFIRIQCAQEKVGPPDRRAPTAREKALFEAHHRAWFDELPEWARPRGYGVGTFRRGFVGVILCTARQWLKGADALYRVIPPERLILYKCKGVVAALARSPHLAGVAELYLHDLEGPAEVGELAAATHLKRLTDFELGNRIGDAGAVAFLRLPFLGRLTRLRLSCNDLGDAAGEALAAAPALARLESLDLSFNALGRRAAAALASSPHLAGLRRLDLAQNRLDAAAARSLAASRTLTRLTDLDLAGNPIGAAGLAALAGSPLLDGLTNLRLANCAVGPEGAEALAATSRPTCLEHLDLLEAGVGDRGAVALARSPICATLLSLNLYGNGIGPEGAVALASSPHLSRLESLRLKGRAIGDDAALDLADSPHLARLRQLNISAEGLSEPTQKRLRERFGYKVWS